MKIRFVTKDLVVGVKECPEIDEPVTVVMSPMWSGVPTPTNNPAGFLTYRKYEFNGQVLDGIPTVREV